MLDINGARVPGSGWQPQGITGRGRAGVGGCGPQNAADTGEGSEEGWENLIWADLAELLRKAYLWTFQIRQLISFLNSPSASELTFLLLATERFLAIEGLQVSGTLSLFLDWIICLRHVQLTLDGISNNP